MGKGRAMELRKDKRESKLDPDGYATNLPHCMYVPSSAHGIDCMAPILWQNGQIH